MSNGTISNLACDNGDPKWVELWTGPAGKDGKDGKDGTDGERGPAGPRGPEGPGGPRGPEGGEGPEGPRGPRGYPGKDGKDGARGPAGADGKDGKDGKDALPGEKGPDGNPGPDGKEGPEGPRGPRGIEGKEGPIGPEGPEGPKGPVGDPGGPEGPAGKDGKDGAPGGFYTLHAKQSSMPSLPAVGNLFEVTHPATQGAIAAFPVGAAVTGYDKFQDPNVLYEGEVFSSTPTLTKVYVSKVIKGNPAGVPLANSILTPWGAQGPKGEPGTGGGGLEVEAVGHDVVMSGILIPAANINQYQSQIKVTRYGDLVIIDYLIRVQSDGFNGESEWRLLNNSAVWPLLRPKSNTYTRSAGPLPDGVSVSLSTQPTYLSLKVNVWPDNPEEDRPSIAVTGQLSYIAEPIPAGTTKAW